MHAKVTKEVTKVTTDNTILLISSYFTVARKGQSKPLLLFPSNVTG